MSEAEFCYDAGQYYADKAQHEREHGVEAMSELAKDKRIRNQRYEIECLKNRIKKLERRIDSLERRKIANDDKPTEKQLAYIRELQEFSAYPLPKFDGTTKAEASKYISDWINYAHQRTDKFGFY